MVYLVPLIIFMDDISGNVSKQWNKHHIIYMLNANLPRQVMEKEFCVCFVTSSPHAAHMELMRAMKQSIAQAAEDGIVAWDCKNEEEVLLIPHGHFVAGDNPMQAEECSHAGLCCNYLCRTCKVGGSKEYKESEVGYNSIFVVGEAHEPESTAAEIRKQFEFTFKPGATSNIKAATASTGISDKTTAKIINTLVELGKKLCKHPLNSPATSEVDIQAAQKKQLEEMLQGTDFDTAINPLLGMDNMNIHLDTPMEILHTILLGVVKYFWAQTVFLLEKGKTLDIFHCRLDSFDKEGLNAPSMNADYICHYKGGLIGKHFKSLTQLMPFVIHDLVPRSVLNAWTLIGELVVLLWHTEIKDTEVYLAKLT
ncbi:hypothetical protein SERLA73DRAFT_50400 [Serpula lacrymans var. lacrymans S7.3]|uniref:Uncharacterized protein n=1 Tax=Serpula lacrymans var. lacrymans (strain S7.3) TaxID=936435 RepID=F8PRF7_SERL3|nr:hypothetical protein SERLA73DRAFT_50400 [Serpula lacrymans var. lacrymans S7.3]